MGKEVRSDADAGITHSNLRRGVPSRQRYGDRTGWRSEFDGIGQQISEDLLEPFRVSPYKRQAVEVRYQFQIFAFCGYSHGINGGLQHVHEVDFMKIR